MSSFVLLDKKETKNKYDEYDMTSVGKPNVQKVRCPQLGRRQIALNVKMDGTISFSDGTCDELVVTSPFEKNATLYITIGASPHVDTVEARVYSFQIFGPPSNTNPATKDNIHDEFTRYGGEVDPDMWTLDLLRGGTIRDNCGSAKMKNTPVQERLPVTETSLYFGGPNGQRFATTTNFDFGRGGVIEFWMRMGHQKRSLPLVAQESKEEDDAQDQKETDSSNSLLEIETTTQSSYVGTSEDLRNCAYMYDNDGVVVQYSVSGSPYDTESYSKLWRIPGAYFGRHMRNTWKKVRIKVDKYHNEALMNSPGLVLRWKQLLPGLTSPRGDWAIDMVKIISAPAPILKPVIQRSFCTDLSTKWDVPASLEEPAGYGEEGYGEEGEGYGNVQTDIDQSPSNFAMFPLPEKCRVEFSGKAGGKALPRAKRMFTIRPGLRITSIVDKTHECSDHMIVLSSNKNYRFNWGSEEKTIKFGWNCDHKVMYTSSESKIVDCKKKGMYKLQIDVTPDKIKFKDDGGCQDMELPFASSGGSEDDPLYLFFGADQDYVPDFNAKSSYSSFENFTVSLYPDTGATSMNHSILKDDFNGNAAGKNANAWSLAPPGENAPMEEGDMEYTVAMDQRTNNGTLNIFGPSDGSRTIRSRKGYTIPFNVSVSLNTMTNTSLKSDLEPSCPSQFMVFTPRKNYHYSKMGGKSTMTIGWDCKSKWIVSGTDYKNKVKVDCVNDGMKEIDINVVVRGSMLSFKDNLGCRTLYAPNPVIKKRRPLYMYLGASGGTKAMPSKFGNIKILGRKQVDGLVASDSTLLADDFNFRCKHDKSMWDAIVGGRVDKDCGGITGCSLHMGKEGERSVTTKTLNVDRGAEINFGLRFGGGESHGVVSADCTGLNEKDLGEFVELQYQSTDDKAGEYKTLATYTAYDFHHILSNFSKITVRLEKDGPIAMASRKSKEAKSSTTPNDDLLAPLPKGIRLRWIQNPHKKHKKCCGHWALDNVEILTLPPFSESIMEDDMLTISKRLWNVPKDEEKNDQNMFPPKHGVGENGVWFSGTYQRHGPMRSKITIPYPDVLLTLTIDRPNRCSNHFIVFSSNPSFTWEWGQQKSDDAIVLAWNCDDKTIYSPSISTPPKGSPNSRCATLGTLKLEIELTATSIKFTDDHCGTLEIGGRPLGVTGPLYMYLGADQDQKGKSTFRELNVRTRAPEIPVVQELSSRFTSLTKTMQSWRTPTEKAMKANTWGVMEASKEDASKGSTGGIWFVANRKKWVLEDGENEEMRTRGTFPGWAMNAMIGLTKNNKCNSHYIVLSTDPNYTFEWGVQGNGLSVAAAKTAKTSEHTTVVMGWNCDDKVLYNSKTPTNDDTPSVSFPCATQGDYSVEINTEMWSLTFEDNLCTPIVVKPNPFQSSDKMYVYIGADGDVAGMKSMFNYVTLKVIDTPATWSMPVVMQDRFDFHGDMDRRIWMMDDGNGTITTTARVDNLCGDLPAAMPGVPTTSLHFGSLIENVMDVATTLPLDMQYGGKISFLLSFGWDGATKIHEEDDDDKEDDATAGSSDEDEGEEPPEDLTSCLGFMHPKDGIEVQYSVDRGRTWITFETFMNTNTNQKLLKNRFANMTVLVDYDTAPLAMTDHTMIRFRQMVKSTMGAATGHWAIGAFELTSEPKPLAPTLEQNVAVFDNFDTDDKFATSRAQWNMFETSGRPTTDNATGRKIMVFGGADKLGQLYTGKGSELTTKSIGVGGADEESTGATIEIQLKRAATNNGGLLEVEQVEQVEQERRESDVTIRFQYTLNDMNNTWKDLAIISDATSDPTAASGTEDLISVYNYSDDGGKTQSIRNYYDDSANEYQTYLLQADLDTMRPDVSFDSGLWATAKFRLWQPPALNASATTKDTLPAWMVDYVAVYVGAKRKGLSSLEFGAEKIARDWCYPVLDTLKPYGYAFGTSMSTVEENAQQSMVRFYGDMNGASTIRSRKTFRAPSTVHIQGEIDSDCSNHVVMLSTDKYYKWDSEPHPDTIRFVYDCGTKTIIGGSSMTSATGKCPAFDQRHQPAPLNATALDIAIAARSPPSNSSIQTLQDSYPQFTRQELIQVLLVHANSLKNAATSIARQEVNRNHIQFRRYLQSIKAKILSQTVSADDKLPYPTPRLFNMTITVDKDRITFVDSLGCEDLTVSFPNGVDPVLGANGTVATASDFYIYVGALRQPDTTTDTGKEEADAATIMARYRGRPSATNGSGFASIEVVGPGSVVNAQDGR